MDRQVVLQFYRKNLEPVELLNSVEAIDVLLDNAHQEASYCLVYTANASVKAGVFSWQVEMLHDGQWKLAPIHVLPELIGKVPDDFQSEADKKRLQVQVIASIKQYEVLLPSFIASSSSSERYSNLFYTITKKQQQSYNSNATKKTYSEVGSHQPHPKELFSNDSVKSDNNHQQEPSILSRLIPRYSPQQARYAGAALSITLGVAALACFFLLHAAWPIVAGLAGACVLCMLCVAASKYLSYQRNNLFCTNKVTARKGLHANWDYLSRPFANI